MKQWTVTYREKSGVKTSVVIEAEDRAGVFAELKQRGINAISITEGVVKVGGGAGSGVSFGFWIVPVLVLVGIGLGGYMLIGGFGSGSSGSGGGSDVASGVGADSGSSGSEGDGGCPNPDDDSSNTNEVDDIQQLGIKPPLKMWLGQPVIKHTIKTNDTIIVQTFITADGKTHKYYQDMREHDLPTATDQILAMMTSPDNQFGAPPLPKLNDFESDFVASLKIPIVIHKSDPVRVKELKERVIAARKEMDGLLKDGISANDVIREYERIQEGNAIVRLEAVKIIDSLLKEGKREEAESLCEKYNEVLDQAGLMTIEMPE